MSGDDFNILTDTGKFNIINLIRWLQKRGKNPDSNGLHYLFRSTTASDVSFTDNLSLVNDSLRHSI